MLPPVRASLLVLIALLGGCATLRAGGGEGPPAEPGRAAYRIWHDHGVWRLRASPGAAAGPHRFQGTVSGLTGGLGDPALRDRALADRVARAGNSVSFDFEVERAETGFDLASTGGCLRFDLFVDGRRRADRVRFGPRGHAPDRLPAVLCP